MPTDSRPGTEALPQVLLLDVNETLSDLAPLAGRFEDVGAPGHLAATWFAGVLRDGFALTVVGARADFARIASQSLAGALHGLPLDRPVPQAVAHVMDGFAGLGVHDDVPRGLRELRSLGLRLVTLSNGAASVAGSLLERAGLRDQVEAVLSVDDAGRWKPAPEAYAYALDRCGVAAERAMLVAVHPWDVDGAARAGLATAWLDRDGGPYPDHFTAPDVTASSLTHLADLLRSRAGAPPARG